MIGTNRVIYFTNEGYKQQTFSKGNQALDDKSELTTCLIPSIGASFCFEGGPSINRLFLEYVTWMSERLDFRPSLGIRRTLWHGSEICHLMPQHDLGLPLLRQMLHKLRTPVPGTIVPDQRPALRNPILIVLPHVEQVARQQHRPRLLQVELHHDGAGRVARDVVQLNPRPYLELVAVEGLPVEAVGDEVLGYVEGVVHLCCAGPEGVFELFFVTPDFDVCLAVSQPFPSFVQ